MTSWHRVLAASGQPCFSIWATIPPTLPPIVGRLFSSHNNTQTKTEVVLLITPRILRNIARPELRFEEIEVDETCEHAGKSIRNLRVREVTGAMIVALRKRDGTFDTTPDPDATLDVGDVIIAAGTPDELRRLEELFAPREAVA